jgi:hypothetical protein
MSSTLVRKKWGLTPFLQGSVPISSERSTHDCGDSGAVRKSLEEPAPSRDSHRIAREWSPDRAARGPLLRAPALPARAAA